MAENIREVTITIEIDTNKNSTMKRFTWDGDETYEEFKLRVVEALGELTELP